MRLFMIQSEIVATIDDNQCVSDVGFLQFTF